MNRIPILYPHVTEEMKKAVQDVLNSQFIGQGPRVDALEKKFQEFLITDPAVAVGSCTDALHLAYILAGINEGDEVLTPVFTCTAGQWPLLWMKAKPKFIDINLETLNVSVDDIKKKITKNTKAIMVVDYGGQPCDYDEIKDITNYYKIPLIEDAAHSIGAVYKNVSVGAIADFTCFSFQAVKTISTGDGGMLCIKNKDLVDKAKRLRWFGIDRDQKFKKGGHWKGDITDLGYKYQMNDITAAMVSASLDDLVDQLFKRWIMYSVYKSLLKSVKIISCDIHFSPVRWLLTIITNNREKIIKALDQNGIDAHPLHYRNDQYTLLKPYKTGCPNMDLLENKILCLPLHMKVTGDNIKTICNIINEIN